MKKRFVGVLLAALLLLGCPACASAGDADVDARAFMDYILENVAFADTLEELDRDVIAWRYGVAEDTEAVVYVGSGATAEEACVFRCTDEAAAKTVYESVEAHLEDMRASFAAYLPAETAKLDAAVFLRAGTCVVLVVTADEDAAGTIGDYLK